MRVISTHVVICASSGLIVKPKYKWEVSWTESLGIMEKFPSTLELNEMDNLEKFLLVPFSKCCVLGRSVWYQTESYNLFIIFKKIIILI